MKKFVASTIAATAVTLVVALFLNSVTPLSTSAQAAINLETEWRLEILGLVDHPMNLTLGELAAMPQTTVEAEIRCVDYPNRAIGIGYWTGVKLGFLLEQAGVSPSAIKVAFFASDGYSTDLPLETARRPDVIVAYENAGIPLGETLRLVAPGKWGYKWIGLLTRIEIVNFDFLGRWESSGYSDDGDIEYSNGGPNMPVLPILPNPTPTQQNATTIPTTSPNTSNSSSTLPPQETQNSPPEAPKPENPEAFPTTPIVLASVVSIATVSAALLVYLRKRKH